MRRLRSLASLPVANEGDFYKIIHTETTASTAVVRGPSRGIAAEVLRPEKGREKGMTLSGAAIGAPD